MGSESLAQTLKRDHCSVVYAGTHIDSASQFISTADVAVVSAELEGSSLRGYEVSQQIRATHPRVEVVMLVNETDTQSVVQSFRSGASGIFGRDKGLEHIGKCVVKVHQGQVWASSREIKAVLNALNSPQRLRILNSSGSDILAPREQEVVQCVAEGFTNREIAERLGITTNTVKNYLFRIFDKLGVSNRVELILYAATHSAKQAAAHGNRLSSPSSSDEIQTISAQLISGSDDARVPCGACIESATVPQYSLARTYLNGLGGPPDKTTALTWFIISETVCEESRELSQIAREQLERELGPVEVERANLRAQQWLRGRGLEPKGSADHDELKHAS